MFSENDCQKKYQTYPRYVRKLLCNIHIVEDYTTGHSNLQALFCACIGLANQHDLPQILKNINMAYRISGKTLTIIGKRMRKLRDSQNRDQVVVAEEAGIDTSYYARIERGEANPTLDVLYAVIKALHCKSSDILPF